MINKERFLKVVVLFLTFSFILNIIFAICIFYSFNRKTTTWDMDSISYDVAQNNILISEWITECNKSEKGIYVLRYKQYDKEQYITTMYIYRTDQYYDQMDVSLTDYNFKTDILNISYSLSPDDISSQSKDDILYFKGYSENKYIDLNIKGNKTKENFVLKDIIIEE